MNAPISLRQLEDLVKSFDAAAASIPVPVLISGQSSVLSRALAVRMDTPETSQEIAKLKSALALLSPDVDRGTGRFYDPAGTPAVDHWLAVVWAIHNLNWSVGRDLARTWSMQCKERFSEDGFAEAWDSFDPDHPNPVGIGSLYKRVKELGWDDSVVQQELPLVADASRYWLLSGSQLAALPSPRWLIKGVLPERGIVALYGPSGSGKSFLVLDAAIAAAEGRRWFGYRSATCPVVYLALEGEAGFKNRVAAWEQEHGHALPDNFKFLLQQPFQLTTAQDVTDLLAVLPRSALVIIDTLNRAAATSDENSSKDMGEILAAAKAIQDGTSGLVLIVHHTGKDASRGARGHSSFFAALDGAIEVERDGERRSWSIAKSRDGVDGIRHGFKLKEHLLGTDADGESITSCTVERDVSLLVALPPPKGSQQKAALKTLRSAFRLATTCGRAGCPPTQTCMTIDDALKAIAGTLGATQPHKRNNRARTLLQGLINSGHLRSDCEADEAWVWRSDESQESQSPQSPPL